MLDLFKMLCFQSIFIKHNELQLFEGDAQWLHHWFKKKQQKLYTLNNQQYYHLGRTMNQLLKEMI